MSLKQGRYGKIQLKNGERVIKVDDGTVKYQDFRKGKPSEIKTASVTLQPHHGGIRCCFVDDGNIFALEEFDIYEGGRLIHERG